MAAVWTYVIVFAATVIWALWEAGLDGWAQVPRLIAPAVVLLLVLTTLPVLRGSVRRFGSGVAAAMVTLAGALGAIGVAQDSVDSGFAQQPEPPAETEPEAPPPAAAPAVPATPAAPVEPEVPVASYVALETGVDWPAYGGTHKAARYSPLTQITPDNVGQLEQIWEFR